jgi:protocatechuate 3,4-dioxygenase beta subunit
MASTGSRIDRRRWLRGAVAASLGLAAARAVGLESTPRQSRGPFYPYDDHVESDADLVKVDGRSGLARGVISHLSGVVRGARGRPLPGVDVEIWQCDANGRYHHPRDRRNAPLDENFQGYGRSRTGAEGGYRFRTIQPVAYPGRAPHIHFTIRGPGFEPLVTQMYVEGAPENDRDWILNRVRDPARRASIVVPFEPHPDLPEQRVARFDIVLG